MSIQTKQLGNKKMSIINMSVEDLFVMFNRINSDCSEEEYVELTDDEVTLQIATDLYIMSTKG